jgi:O-antigen ligase
VHVFLSFIIFNFPFIEKYFTIFLNREQEFLGGHVRDGFYTRATSIFTGGEEFGELLVLLFPFALYKIFTSRKKIYSLVLGAFLLGAIISGTRSAFLLIIFQVITFVYILVPKKYNTQKIVISVTLVTIILLMFPVIFKYSFILVERLRMTVELTGHNNDITSMVNRSMVWPPAYALTISTISLFGHGPTQAHVLGYPVYNFHCLYLSLIFQLGIIGSIVFLFFLFILVKRLWNSLRTCKIQEKEYLLVVTCLLSLICFLINEIKFEFNRSDSYQQFVWICFAIFCLIGLQNREYKIEKN